MKCGANSRSSTDPGRVRLVSDGPQGDPGFGKLAPPAKTQLTANLTPPPCDVIEVSPWLIKTTPELSVNLYIMKLWGKSDNVTRNLHP
jgi:hypothetical protein